MEYCENGTLKSLINSNSNHRSSSSTGLAEGEIRHHLRSLVSGLKYIHSLNLVHRDLKSENILLSSSPTCLAFPVLKIGDFGIASSLQNPNDNLTKKIGTLHYMAPEILTRSSYDGRCDLWSVGIILFGKRGYKVLKYHRPPSI